MLYRYIFEAWRVDYNEARPHSALGQLTRSGFAKHSIFCNQISLIPAGCKTRDRSSYYSAR